MVVGSRSALLAVVVVLTAACAGERRPMPLQLAPGEVVGQDTIVDVRMDHDTVVVSLRRPGDVVRGERWILNEAGELIEALSGRVVLSADQVRDADLRRVLRMRQAVDSMARS